MDENTAPLTLLEISEASKKRIALIDDEFTRGYEFVKNHPRSVTFFGSARTKAGDHYYEKARSLAGKIVQKSHYSVITGGGPGVMEAANRGAYEAGGNSLGMTIELPREQSDNKYLTDKENFHYFFSRKVCLSFSAEAFLFFPGGFGTLNEFLEVLTLIQTNKIPKAPMILVGESFWKPLQTYFKETLLAKKMISEEDLSLYTITDDDDEIIRLIMEAPVRMGLRYNEKPAKPDGEQPQNHHEPLSGLLKKFF